METGTKGNMVAGKDIAQQRKETAQGTKGKVCVEGSTQIEQKTKQGYSVGKSLEYREEQRMKKRSTTKQQRDCIARQENRKQQQEAEAE